MTVGDASHALGVSANTIRRYCESGVLRAIWTPYGRLLSAAQVRDLKQSRETAAA